MANTIDRMKSRKAGLWGGASTTSSSGTSIIIIIVIILIIIGIAVAVTMNRNEHFREERSDDNLSTLMWRPKPHK